MKKLLIALVLLIVIPPVVIACRSSTDFGECIGIGDDPTDPCLIYSTSGRNVAWGIVCVESIVVPAVVLASDFKCPVARKRTPECVAR